MEKALKAFAKDKFFGLLYLDHDEEWHLRIILPVDQVTIITPMKYYVDVPLQAHIKEMIEFLSICEWSDELKYRDGKLYNGNSSIAAETFKNEPDYRNLIVPSAKSVLKSGVKLTEPIDNKLLNWVNQAVYDDGRQLDRLAFIKIEPNRITATNGYRLHRGFTHTGIEAVINAEPKGYFKAPVQFSEPIEQDDGKRFVYSYQYYDYCMICALHNADAAKAGGYNLLNFDTIIQEPEAEYHFTWDKRLNLVKKYKSIELGENLIAHDYDKHLDLNLKTQIKFGKPLYVSPELFIEALDGHDATLGIVSAMGYADRKYWLINITYDNRLAVIASRSDK